MRLGYFADGPWAHQALERIVERDSLAVAFIVARDQDPDPVLGRRADELGVPFVTHPNVNTPEFVDQVRSWAPDVNVSMSFDQILKKPLIDVAHGGFINCHAGALPFYRGRNVLNWALINGETRIGVTVHYVDEGIDTGDIILQRFFPVAENDAYAVVVDRAAALCAATLAEALDLISRNSVQVIRQADVHPVGMYCSRRREGDEWIDWSWPSERLHNFVRAIAPPGPGGRTHLGDDVIAVTETRRIPGALEYLDRPGTVVGRDAAGVVVKTGDSTIWVTRWSRSDGRGGFVDAAIPDFRIGTVLGVGLWQALSRLHERVSELEDRVANAGLRNEVS